MSDEVQVVAPGPHDRTVLTADGQVVAVPNGWRLLPPGDAALTRRVKLAGPHWLVQERKGRRTFSRGIWAPEVHIAKIQEMLQSERGTVQYAARRASELQRREKNQSAYVEDFHAQVRAFLKFAPCYTDLADRLAQAVTQHATPVGSGTVARTQRIPLAQRAEAAVIAWLRHQTTSYESMSIRRVKGERRRVRRRLAEQSRHILDAYRRGIPVNRQTCPLQMALGHFESDRAAPNIEPS